MSIYPPGAPPTWQIPQALLQRRRTAISSSIRGLTWRFGLRQVAPPSPLPLTGDFPPNLLANPSFEALSATGIQTNLVTNPSFEVDDVGWTPIGAYQANGVLVGDGSSGLSCLRIATSAGSAASAPGRSLALPGLTTGQVVNISCYVKKVSGSTGNFNLDIFGGGFDATGAVQSIASMSTSWTRLSSTFAFTGTSGTASVRFFVDGSPADNVEFRVDAVQVEYGTAPTPYIDGGQPGARWAGTPHASQTYRMGNPDIWGVGGPGAAVYGTSTTDPVLFGLRYPTITKTDWSGTAGDRYNAYFQAVTSIQPDTVYTFSVYYKLSVTPMGDEPRYVGFVLAWYTPAVTFISNSVDWGWPATSQWIRRTFTVRSPTNSGRVHVELRMSCNGVANFDGVQVEANTEASPFHEGFVVPSVPTPAAPRHDFEVDGTGNVPLTTASEAAVTWAAKAVTTQRGAHLIYSRDFGTDIRRSLRAGSHQAVQNALQTEMRRAVKRDVRIADLTNFEFRWRTTVLEVAFAVVLANGQRKQTRLEVPIT